eukprot:scaffold3685_cov242-Pinguiococcus_pyrenoidosus.AAC.3
MLKACAVVGGGPCMTAGRHEDPLAVGSNAGVDERARAEGATPAAERQRPVIVVVPTDEGVQERSHLQRQVLATRGGAKERKRPLQLDGVNVQRGAKQQSAEADPRIAGSDAGLEALQEPLCRNLYQLGCPDCRRQEHHGKEDVVRAAPPPIHLELQKVLRVAVSTERFQQRVREEAAQRVLAESETQQDQALQRRQCAEAVAKLVTRYREALGTEEDKKRRVADAGAMSQHLRRLLVASAQPLQHDAQHHAEEEHNCENVCGADAPARVVAVVPLSCGAWKQADPDACRRHAGQAPVRHGLDHLVQPREEQPVWHDGAQEPAVQLRQALRQGREVALQQQRLDWKPGVGQVPLVVDAEQGDEI